MFEAPFKSSLASFFEEYKVDYIQAINYIKTTCIAHRRAFVSCSVDYYLHFGTLTTSRVEGNHYVIKEYLVLKNPLFALMTTHTTVTNCGCNNLGTSYQLNEIESLGSAL